MKLSMHRHFILVAIAILFELNKVASSRRRWQSNGKCSGSFNIGDVNCGGHRAKTCSQCPCDKRGLYLGLAQEGQKYCNGHCQWRRGACRPNNKCAGAVFNTGNVICGRHRATTCSRCPCTENGEYANDGNMCNGDCQWRRGDHGSGDFTGECIMRRKINKGEWHLGSCPGMT